MAARMDQRRNEDSRRRGYMQHRVDQELLTWTGAVGIYGVARGRKQFTGGRRGVGRELLRWGAESEVVEGRGQDN